VDNGAVSRWGANYYGELGDGRSTISRRLVLVTGWP
jgi:hypothetical protein